MDASALLTGPRGRRLCLEVLLAHARSADTSATQDAAQAVFWAARALDASPGSLIVFRSDDDPAGPEEEFVEPVATAADVASALQRVAVPELDTMLWREALLASVDAARYWQYPDGTDVLAAAEELGPALARVARAIAVSPAGEWWQGPIDLANQWRVEWEEPAAPEARAEPHRDPAATLTHWRTHTAAEEVGAAASWPTDPHAAVSGTWWSTPPAELVRTTRTRDGLGPLGLTFVEDSLGWTAAAVTRVAAPSARVFEIGGADDWVQLCRRHPLVVTASRRHDWYRINGRDGVWVQPDWAAVAGEVDGVHLSVAGYLEAAGRAIPLGDGTATVLAGWTPDETYWFVPAPDAGAPQRWVRHVHTDPTVWQRRRDGH